MKKMVGVLLGILMALFMASSANAAWTYEQTFNNLNNGDLSGQDSWSGAVEYDIQSSVTYEGTKAVKVNAVTTSQLIERTVPSFTSGQMYFSVRRDTNSTGYFGVYLRNSVAGHVAFIYFKPDGNISAYEGPEQTERILGTYISNTWYRIGIDYSASTDQYRVNVNNGAWSSYYATVVATTEINQIKLYADGNANSYLDFIGPNYAFSPVISSVSASNIGQTSATITWTTDVQATSQVEYGTTTSYGNLTTLDPALVTSHSVNLTGLTANTTYHYRVRSKDASNNESISGDYTFHTIAPLSLRLPFRSGESWQVTQGNSKDCTPPNPNNYSHCIGSSLEFAWDFGKSGAHGSDVLAPASGKIVDASAICLTENDLNNNCNDSWGNYVIIDYGNGKFGKLAHLRLVTVKKGQYVFQGEKIGTCGSTGKSSGPHIHYQTQSSSALNGQSINPLVDSNAKFVDSGIPNGIPTELNWYTSSNTTPVAIYHLDTTFDTSGNGNNATSNPSCVMAGCLNLNGTSNYLEAPDSSSLSLTTGVNLSISGWLKTTSSSTQWIVSKYNNGASDASYGLYLSNGYVKFTVSPNGSTGGEVQSTVGINDGNRRHVVVTYDGMELRIYLEGALNTWQSYVISNIFDSSSPLRIGAKNSQTAMEFFSEMLDEVVIYGRTLTADEVNNMYYSSKP